MSHGIALSRCIEKLAICLRILASLRPQWPSSNLLRIFLLPVTIFALFGCAVGTPDVLAQVVLKQQIAEIGDEFALCIAVDSKDADPALLAALQEKGRVIVPSSECVWEMGPKGSYHRLSGKKAMLINVSANRARGEVEYEAKHNGKWATFRTLKVSEEHGEWKVIGILKNEFA